MKCKLNGKSQGGTWFSLKSWHHLIVWGFPKEALFEEPSFQHCANGIKLDFGGINCFVKESDSENRTILLA